MIAKSDCSKRLQKMIAESNSKKGMHKVIAKIDCKKAIAQIDFYSDFNMIKAILNQF